MRLMEQWIELAEVRSTQEIASELLKQGSAAPGVIFAHHQTQGRGRLGRTWLSQEGQSLTMSLIFSEYKDQPKPWLLGMKVAVVCAEVIDCDLRWPNDLAYGEAKTGGILTEVFPDREGRAVAVVGVGINLLQTEFPDELSFATSVFKARGVLWEPMRLAAAIVDRLRAAPAPNDWTDIKPAWAPRDRTPGKQYRLPGGEVGVAKGLGDDGSLVVELAGDPRQILAAEAIFSPSLPMG